MYDTEHSSEIHKLLKIGAHTEPHLNIVPESLPIAAIAIEKPVDAVFMKSIDRIQETASLIKNFLIYPVIFVFAFIFFYFVLNFSSITSQVQGYFSKPADEQILGPNLTEYYTWINNYYYAVNDKKLLDPNNDIDKDGLSNNDEFVMRTNPILADSDADGFSDGTEIMNNYNPWGVGALSAKQTELVKSLDMILVNNRISYNASAHTGIVSGINTSNYDLTTYGRISIPRLNLQVPLVWSKDPADFDNDLNHGVIHYPGTALPGEKGTIYVSGHSSDYLWKKNPFHNIFAQLNFLKPGDDIFVDVSGIDGKVYNYRYQVTGTQTYKPDDQTQFIDASSHKLNLSTCWPIGTQKDRLVVSAVQVAL